MKTNSIVRGAMPLVALLCAGVLPMAGATLTTTLRPETLRAFKTYSKTVEAELQQRVKGNKPFLWLEDSPKRLQKVRKGDILTQQFEVKMKVPHGIIHDWLGAMLIPGARLDNVVHVLQDFDRHAKIYPEVIASKLLSKKGNVYRSRVKVVKEKVLTATLNIDYENHYEKIGDDKVFCRSYTPRITQVEEAGTPQEHELPEGKDSGFLWKMDAYWSLQQVPEGVLVELRTISLSRDIPTGLGWMIKPFITSIPKESLLSTLQATRLAVKK